jgi:DNA invertase Pin-like site-specific DNA recombinase
MPTVRRWAVSGVSAAVGSLRFKHTVSFVAVTQQFNTSTSLGRLTLNILLSFAQFERELIGERTRDKMSAARRKGKWVGGCPVLGYDVGPGGGRHRSRDAKAASEMRDLPARTAAGRNPEDDVACGRTEVAVAWSCRSLHSLVQDGKSHGNN